MYCVWQVVKTLTIISNNPVYLVTWGWPKGKAETCRQLNTTNETSCVVTYCKTHFFQYTCLFEIIVEVLTTRHTQYTWDSSICVSLFNRTTLQVFVTYLTGALYVHPLWFYKHQHDNWFRSKLFVACQRWWFQWQFAAILVNCAPSGEMHNYCTPHIIKENYENFLIHRCNYILLSQVYCVWQVVKTPTIILNNPVPED